MYVGLNLKALPPESLNRGQGLLGKRGLTVSSQAGYWVLGAPLGSASLGVLQPGAPPPAFLVFLPVAPTWLLLLTLQV